VKGLTRKVSEPTDGKRSLIKKLDLSSVIMSRKTKEMFNESVDFQISNEDVVRVTDEFHSVTLKKKLSKQCGGNGRSRQIDFSVEAVVTRKCHRRGLKNTIFWSQVFRLKFGFTENDIKFLQGLGDGGLGAQLIVFDESENSRKELMSFDLDNINQSEWKKKFNSQAFGVALRFQVVQFLEAKEEFKEPAAQPISREELEHLSDVEVKTGSMTLKCHKAFLAKHSKVFNAMFQHSCVEKESGIIKIDDFEEDTVADFIAFIYEGRLEDDARYTVQLLGIANKYNVEVLQKACAKYLASDIKKENIADLWVAAELCQMPELLRAVQEFLKNNWGSRGEMPGIDDVIRNHPEFMCGLVTHLI